MRLKWIPFFAAVPAILAAPKPSLIAPLMLAYPETLATAVTAPDANFPKRFEEGAHLASISWTFSLTPESPIN